MGVNRNFLGEGHSSLGRQSVKLFELAESKNKIAKSFKVLIYDKCFYGDLDYFIAIYCRKTKMISKLRKCTQNCGASLSPSWTPTISAMLVCLA